MKVYWLCNNIGIIGKFYFLFIINIIDEYIVAIAIYYNLKKGYNKYEYI